MVVGRAVGVDHVARMRGDEHRSAERVGEVVQALEMPVGVGERARSRAVSRASIARRHVRADVRHRQQQRSRALAQAECGGALAPVSFDRCMSDVCDARDGHATSSARRTATKRAAVSALGAMAPGTDTLHTRRVDGVNRRRAIAREYVRRQHLLGRQAGERTDGCASSTTKSAAARRRGRRPARPHACAPPSTIARVSAVATAAAARRRGHCAAATQDAGRTPASSALRPR